MFHFVLLSIYSICVYCHLLDLYGLVGSFCSNLFQLTEFWLVFVKYLILNEIL